MFKAVYAAVNIFYGHVVLAAQASYVWLIPDSRNSPHVTSSQ